MSDTKLPIQPSTPLKATLTPKPPDAKPQEEKKPEPVVNVPKEFSAKGDSAIVRIDDKEITIDLAPVIAEEVGAYRRCRVKIVFQEKGMIRVIPQLV